MSSSTPTVDPASSVIRAMVTVTLVFLLGLGAIVITAVSVKGNSGAAGGSGAATTTAKIGLKEYSVTGTMTAFSTSYTTFANGFGTWAPAGGVGVKKTYQIVATLNAGAPNTVQSGTAAIGFTWEEQNS